MDTVVCVSACLISMLCLDVGVDILSPPVFSVVSACGRCVEGEADERKGRESCVCVVVFFRCRRGNDIGKVVFRGS